VADYYQQRPVSAAPAQDSILVASADGKGIRAIASKTNSVKGQREGRVVG
jgi:hypothetical protein